MCFFLIYFFGPEGGVGGWGCKRTGFGVGKIKKYLKRIQKVGCNDHQHAHPIV